MSIPKGSPPPGGDQNRGPSVLAVSFTSICLAVVVVSLRLYARIKLVRKVGWDDVLIVAATVISCVGVGLNVPEVIDGVGRHDYYLTPVETSEAIKWSTMAQAQNVLSTGLIKISICVALLRILISKPLARFLYALIAVMIVTTAVIFAAIVSQCRPLTKLWNPSIEGKCWPPMVLPQIGRAQGIISIVTDLICTGFPVLILRKVKISRRTKFGLCGLMSLGLVASGCCVARVVLQESIAEDDFTWGTVDVMIWAVLEQNLGIIAACIPALRPLFKKLFDRSGNGSEVRLTGEGGYRSPSASLGTPIHTPTKAHQAPSSPSKHHHPSPQAAQGTTDGGLKIDIAGRSGGACSIPLRNMTIRKTTRLDQSHEEGYMSDFDGTRKAHETMVWSSIDIHDGHMLENHM